MFHVNIGACMWWFQSDRSPDLCRCWSMKWVIVHIFMFVTWWNIKSNHSVCAPQCDAKLKQREAARYKKKKKYLFNLWWNSTSWATPAKRAWEGKPKAEAVMITRSARTVNLSVCRRLFMHGKELNCNGAELPILRYKGPTWACSCSTPTAMLSP